ncbi:hypothetical protein VL15_28780 [Burkholderia cepacia]|uniref:Uncharacterized protein n=1 Tax=Burkholderia cepacia TaxID=292 RepID=A0A0J5WGR4_BURCE|nr:hypothetical protein [Burkholderia cepacia]KML48655.1 hypothetical protein VL15_28780 [Burkholderia cepacia]
MTSWTRRGIRRERIYLICEWLTSFALFLLPVFFMLFCMVLFGVWYFGSVEWWLGAASTLLVAGMGVTAGIFGIASASFVPQRDTLAAAEHCRRDDAAPAPPLDFIWMQTVPCHHPMGDEGGFRVNCFNIDCTRRATGRAPRFPTGKPPCR